MAKSKAELGGTVNPPRTQLIGSRWWWPVDLGEETELPTITDDGSAAPLEGTA